MSLEAAFQRPRSDTWVPVRADLHRHLEGSHSPHALAEVAQRFGIHHPLLFDAEAGKFRTAEELSPQLTLTSPSDDALLFYECIKKARVAYVSVEAIRALTQLAFEEAAIDSPQGLEMRLSLFSMTRTLLENEGREWRTVSPVAFAELARELLLAVLSARDEVQRKTGVTLLARLGFSRTFESEPHYRAMGAMVAEHAEALSGLDVLGIVTGADKEPLPPALVEIIGSLRPVLPDLTIHAGEFEGHASVDRTLALEPQGIGHGVHSAQSERTMKRLADSGVTLEVCPTSNYLLIPTALRKLQHDCSAHPLVALQKAHVRCVIGSDDPTPMGTDFRSEWARAERLGADVAQLERDVARRWAQLTNRRNPHTDPR